MGLNFKLTHYHYETAKPSLPRFAAVSAAGHRRQDDDGVAVGDRGLEPVEHPHVLVVEVDVDVAVEVAVLAEELLSVSGCSAVSARSTSPTFAPAASTSGLPPVCGPQHWRDRVTVAIGAGRSYRLLRLSRRRAEGS